MANLALANIFKRGIIVAFSLWLLGSAAELLAQTDALPTPDADGIIYVEVQDNDSLWSIAARAGLSLADLLAFNDMTEDAVIQPGDRLIVGRVTPAPTATPIPPATPTLPPPTPSPTEGPNKTAVCLLAFEDSNQDGVHDANEPLKAGVVFTVFNNEAVIGNYVTDGISEPSCLEGLQPGNYQVTRSVGTNETLTTDGNWSLRLAKDAILTQAFGSHEQTAASPTQPPTATATLEAIQGEPAATPQLTPPVGEETVALWERPLFWLTLGILLLLGAALLWWLRRPPA